MSYNPLSEKSKNDKLKLDRITNNDLVCKDCLNQFDDSENFGNTSKCLAYELKPTKVMNGENCDERIKEE